MANPSGNPDSASEIERLRRELAEKAELIQGIRRDLIHAQISILELNDTILAKETDKADAVSILGELEHQLELKVNYIFDLDRELNRQISGLRTQLANETASRDATIKDLVARLDAANREIGATHELAAKYARELSDSRERVAQTLADLTVTRTELDATNQRLRVTEAARAALDREATAMRRSWSWRLTRPFRAVRALFR
jgi:chromosome segregation ATPase